MTVLKLSSGPTGAPSHGMSGQLQHQRLERRLLARPAAVSSSPACAPASLALAPSAARLLGRGVLEPRADRVALGAQRLDLGLERRAPRRRAPSSASRSRSTPLSRIARSTVVAVRLDEIHAQHGPVRQSCANGKLRDCASSPKRRSMPSGLIALLDDVATIAKLAAASVDDVGAAAGKAGTKAAGVVIDDTAVTPRYVIGLAPERELPIIGKIALGQPQEQIAVPAARRRCC